MHIHLPRRRTVVAVLVVVGFCGASAFGAQATISGSSAAEPQLDFYTVRGQFTIPIADVRTHVVECRGGLSNVAVSGGFQVVSGNYVQILTAATTADAH